MSTTLSAPVIAASQPGMADALRAALELELRGIFDPILCKSWRRTGSGARGDAEGPFDYDRFATDIGAVVDHIGKPFVVVGHSMGSAIAELVPAARPDRAMGLALLAPVPLAGRDVPTAGLLGETPRAVPPCVT
jgi:pimeloyl-ACP methyl ester carboxylesterase